MNFNWVYQIRWFFLLIFFSRKILTGTISKTSGKLNIGKGGKNIGVCPQNNVLFDVLTPMEHLDLYSKLKMGNAEVEKDMIDKYAYFLFFY